MIYSRANFVATCWIFLIFLLINISSTLAQSQPGTGQFNGEIKTEDAHKLWSVKVLGLGKTMPGQITSLFGIRYKYSTLLGEPITYQVGWYQIMDYLIVKRDVNTHLIIKAGGGSEPRLENGTVEIPREWFQDLLIQSYDAKLKFSDGKYNLIIARDRGTGIMGRSGEWGWDMAGSPDWAEVFEDWGMDKESWSNIADVHKNQNLAGTYASFEPENIVVDASVLIARIQKYIPEVMGLLYPRKLDLQAATLLSSLEQLYQRSKNQKPNVDYDIRRLRAGLERFFVAFGSDISSGLNERWRILKALPDRLASLDRQVQFPVISGDAALKDAIAAVKKNPELLAYNNRAAITKIVRENSLRLPEVSSIDRYSKDFYLSWQMRLPQDVDSWSLSISYDDIRYYDVMDKIEKNPLEELKISFVESGFYADLPSGHFSNGNHMVYVQLKTNSYSVKKKMDFRYFAPPKPLILFKSKKH